MTKASPPSSLKVAAVLLLLFAAPAALIEVASAHIHALAAKAPVPAHLGGGMR